ENLSEIIMDRLNSIFRERLETGIKIFRHKHPKKFLSQLVSSQLDMDRLDYLSRDSFFTGVSEGIIGTQRIIKMLNVSAGNLVIDEKGIYSIEKYIIARRIMYWQVYLHKTVLSAENMLIKILERAKLLVASGQQLFATPAFSFFLENQQSSHEIFTNPDALENFTMLDDFDILTSIKTWTNNPDVILSSLCKRLINRNLFRCIIQPEPFDYFYIEELKAKISKKLRLSENELGYFFISDTTSNYAYNIGHDNIYILSKDGKVTEIGNASDHLNISVLSKATTKHFICYPKDVDN
ncbi:MAG: phosphohydrolase, partial [Bacteroidales bacterium]|nr:phosphohydrolase [Bacteroidales bacterium]